MSRSFLKSILLILVPLLASSLLQAKLTIGETAPHFTLEDITGQGHSLVDFRGQYVVLEWFNHGCPFVKKHYDQEAMQKLQKEYTEKGVIWLAIDSTHPEHRNYRTVAQANEEAQTKKTAATAIFLDSNGKTGKAYHARTTPHLFIIDPQGALIYQGAIDSINSTDSADVAKATNYVRQALDEALAGEPVSKPQTKPYGCSVKYK